MGVIVDTGLGWYLDSDYLITLGSQTLGTVDGGGGGGGAALGGYLSNTPGELLFTTSSRQILITKINGEDGAFAGLTGINNWSGCWVGVSTVSDQAVYVSYNGYPIYTGTSFVRDGVTYYINTAYWDQNFTPESYVPTYDLGGVEWDLNNTILQNFLIELWNNASGITKTITKVQGGAGAFAFVSYPHEGATVYAGVGISSIPNPNSAATVAVDGVNGDYNTFNRENIQFTMYYTEPLSGELTANVPVVIVDTDISDIQALYEARLFLAVANAAQIHAGPVPVAPEDPYEGGGTSGPGGGTDTDFDITGDTILDSSLPAFSFANSGFARIYNPDLSQLQRLATYLWTDTTFLQTIVNHAKQLLEDPIESIITLNRLPISVPNGTAEVVKVLFIPTNTSMPPVTNQFVDVDCGTLQIKHEYDSALDYNPYTDISLVLPFIGVVQLDPDEVMDKTLSLTYRVDVVSGMCVAKVAVDGCVLYQYSGNCAISMPFNSADFSNYISAMVTAAKSITGVAAAGAAGAMAAAAEGTEAVKAIVAKATSGETESTGPSLPAPSNKSINVFKETFGKGGVGEGTLKAAKKGVANTVGAVVSSKRTIEHAGHFSGNSGFLGVRRPYAIIKRPKMCNPEEYGRFNGRPCMMYLHLGNLSGYTEVQEIHLTGILATNDELIEIENLLKSGVIL